MGFDLILILIWSGFIECQNQKTTTTITTGNRIEDHAKLGLVIKWVLKIQQYVH